MGNPFHLYSHWADRAERWCLSLCSHLCLTCSDDGIVRVVGWRMALAGRADSSAQSTSARNGHRRAWMLYRDLIWSPNRHTTSKRRSDRGRRFPGRSPIFTFDHLIQWIWEILKRHHQKDPRIQTFLPLVRTVQSRGIITSCRRVTDPRGRRRLVIIPISTLANGRVI